MQLLNKHIWKLFTLVTSNLFLLLWKINLHTPRQFAFIDISSTKQIYLKKQKLFLNAYHELPSRHKRSSRHLRIVLELSCLDNTFLRYLQGILELSCLDKTFSRYLQDILELSCLDNTFLRHLQDIFR